MNRISQSCMRILSIILLLVTPFSALAGVITIEWTGTGQGALGASLGDVGGTVSFELRNIPDRDVSSERDDFAEGQFNETRSEWANTFVITGTGSDAQGGGGATIGLIDSPSGDEFILNVRSFITGNTRFSQKLTLRIFGDSDALLPGSGGLTNELFDLATFLDGLSLDSFDGGFGSVGAATEIPFEITAFRATYSDVSVPPMLGLLGVFALGIRFRHRRNIFH